MLSSERLPSIGIFDSGVGGLSVLREIQRELPLLNCIYFADQAHVPYGDRTLDEVRTLSESITRYLLSTGASIIVVACNTASAAALHYLREVFPSVPFVGMEPAVKPAAKNTYSGIVGVLATPATFQGELYASLIERYTTGITVLQNSCPGLVQLIENGDLNSLQARGILERALKPMIAQDVDTVVLGCTHYPFVIPRIKEIVGPEVQVIDPAPAVARQTRRLIEKNNLLASINYAHDADLSVSPTNKILTTGDPDLLSKMINLLLGEAMVVDKVSWNKDHTDIA